MGESRIMLGLIALALGAAPAFAQDNQANSAAPTTTTPAPADSVGPRELRDFSLGGTVTRRQEATPAPAPAATTTRTPRAVTPAPPRSAAPATTRDVPATEPAPREKVLPEPALARRDRADIDVPAPRSSANEAIPASTVAQSNDLPLTTVVAPNPTPSDGDAPLWPWLMALAVATAGALFVWRRRRSPPELAYAGWQRATSPEPDRAPPPQPKARAVPVPAPPEQRAPSPALDDGFVSVRAPVPAPVPTRPPIPDGIVASRLAPKLIFDLKPMRADVDAAGNAALMYELVVTNSGSAPARDVLIEAKLVNAGPAQDSDIAAFFQNPVGRGERIALIAPMQKVVVRGRIAAASADYRPLELDGRRLLVPLVAFNAIYRGGGGDRQDSASFLVGRGGSDGQKMAPMPIDGAAHAWAGLSARTHSQGLRS